MQKEALKLRRSFRAAAVKGDQQGSIRSGLNKAPGNLYPKRRGGCTSQLDRQVDGILPHRSMATIEGKPIWQILHRI